jgi:glycosyltransferase involved in cell wall biosynthesis
MKSVFYVGYNVFPLGFAQTQRELLIAKGLVETGCKVTVLCRFGTHDDKDPNVQSGGVFESVHYKYCSGSAYRSNSFLKRNFYKSIGFVNEISTIIKAKINKELDAILITTNTFENVLIYTLLGKLINTQTIIDNTEYWTSVKRHSNVWGDYLYDKYSFRLANKVIGISDFLLEKYKEKKDASLLFKIPAVVDFSKFDNGLSKVDLGFKYFLFCGSGVYSPLIEFIIDSFDLLNDNNYHLILVCSNGIKSDFDVIDAKIASSKKANLIHLKSHLPYSELTELYVSSVALLIPLRPTSQDTARFPHKIGEYCASKRPIITTNFGEIRNYFQNGVNAYVSEKYEVIDYAQAMEQSIKDSDMTESVAQESYKIGKANFDYKVWGQKLYDFIFNK